MTWIPVTTPWASDFTEEAIWHSLEAATPDKKAGVCIFVAAYLAGCAEEAEITNFTLRCAFKDAFKTQGVTLMVRS